MSTQPDEAIAAGKCKLCIYMFVYWHDSRFKKTAGGPIKVFELTDHLARRGHDINLFIPKLGCPGQQTSARVYSVSFLDLPILRFITFQAAAFFQTLYLSLKNGRPDVVYVRIMWSFLPMLLARILSIPVILEINDSPYQAYKNIRSMFKRSIVRLIDRISFRLSDHVFPVTQGIAEKMHAMEGIPWEKMTVLPSGANTDLFRPLDRKYCSKKTGLDGSFCCVGFTGTFFHHQGLDTLIESAPILVRERPDIRFLLLGDGPMRAAWEKRVRDTGMMSSFIFTGNVPYTEVPLYCGLMDVCVAPFLKGAEERSPVKIFDYLACGKPVVATDVGETSTFFSESGALVIVPPENPEALAKSILDLLADQDLRSRMGAAGRDFILNHCSRTKIAEAVETVAVRFASMDRPCRN